uniref:50S ribosomal protein L14 n=1 Tax=Nephromyces sp. ex Molgula occidentalis TaxID=2544991 RepID=A0A5C1H8E3_9APIC|nr:50S ribosomal protein L14 [Nephromyces sp. ex Molgula occidentalis]
MNKIGSYFNVADNTGVKQILCVGLLKSKKKSIKIGDFLVGIVKNTKNTKHFKKSTIVKAIVIRLKVPLKLKTGWSIKFTDNAVVLVDNNLNPLGTRVFGYVPKILKKKNYFKLISIVKDFI